MRAQRRNVIVAVTVIAGMAAGPASAQEAPAGPSGSAGANAVAVDGVATVSGTSATTGNGGSAEAAVIQVAGSTVVGGSQEGTGSNGGEILTTGETDQGSITVGGWKAEVGEDGSRSESAVLVAQGPRSSSRTSGSSDGDPRVEVLRSSSDASSSGSSAATTGARISMGGNSLQLLSAESSSEGSGAAYLVGANDQRIGTSEQADGRCRIDANPLAELICLYAEAISAGDDADDPDGHGGTGASTGVVDSSLADGNLLADLFTSTASQTTAPGDPKPPTGDPEDPDGDPKPPAGGDDPLPAPGDDGELPVTGGGLTTSLLGLLSLGSAAALRRYAR